MRVRAFLLAALLLETGCSGGSGPIDPPEPREVLVVSLARRDRSPTESLEGYLVFFFDRDTEVLLSASPVINGRPVDEVFSPGIVPGPAYAEGINVDPGETYELTADVTRPGTGSIQVSSAPVTVPTGLVIDVPDEVDAGGTLLVGWSVAGAEKVNVAVGSVFSIHVPASQGQLTIPDSVFAGRPSGQELEVEITAYNTFYEPLGAAISTLSDAEAAAEKFRGIDNVTGGVGVFGAAFTLGHVVTVR
jgi:hypothetical protein